MIYRGLNCGFGNTDCAELTEDVVDLERGWIEFPRPKTHVFRKAPGPALLHSPKVRFRPIRRSTD